MLHGQTEYTVGFAVTDKKVGSNLSQPDSTLQTGPSNSAQFHSIICIDGLNHRSTTAA